MANLMFTSHCIPTASTWSSHYRLTSYVSHASSTSISVYKIFQVTASAQIPRQMFKRNGNFLPTLPIIISNPTISLPTIILLLLASLQALPLKYNILYNTGQAIFNNASMDAFSPCNRPCLTPISLANDVMAAVVPTFWVPPYRPMHPANRTARPESVRSIDIGKSIDDRMANREKLRRPNDWRTRGNDMLETIPPLRTFGRRPP